MDLPDKFEGGEGLLCYIFDMRVLGHVGSNEYNKCRETKLYHFVSNCFEIGVGCFFAKTEPEMLELFLS